MPDRNSPWYHYQHLLILFAIFYEGNIKGTNFRIMLINMFYVCIMCLFCIVFQVVQMLIIYLLV